jgi:hypothetical protein
MRTALAIVVLLAFSCVEKERPPDDLLDPEVFTAMLVDAQLIEARVNHELVVQYIGTAPTAAYYAELFERYGVDEDRFARTFHWYAAHPEELKVIYEEVFVRLSRRQDEPRPVP